MTKSVEESVSGYLAVAEERKLLERTLTPEEQAGAWIYLLGSVDAALRYVVAGRYGAHALYGTQDSTDVDTQPLEAVFPILARLWNAGHIRPHTPESLLSAWHDRRDKGKGTFPSNAMELAGSLIEGNGGLCGAVQSLGKSLTSPMYHVAPSADLPFAWDAFIILLVVEEGLKPQPE